VTGSRTRLALVAVTVLALGTFAVRHLTRVRAAGLPGSVRIVTADIERFWDVYDRATQETLAELLERDYLAAGTEALRDFVPMRILSADALARKILDEPERYERIREGSLSLQNMEREIREPFLRLEELYPPAVHPDVYFVIGRFNSGGTVSRRGILVGAEMVADDPDAVPGLIAHELVHFQQVDIPRGRFSLLAQAIREGSADFVGELISGGGLDEETYGYGFEHEAELWREFQKDMFDDEVGGWLYGGQPEGRPADLGYFIGYRIAQAFYERSDDRSRAIREVLTVRDYERFLERSGYRP